MNDSRIDQIRSRLQEVFAPEHLEIFDDSHLHEGHEGAREGKGHYRVDIVSTHFSGARPVERHRMVFQALGELMETDIHALSVSARTPNAPTASDN